MRAFIELLAVTLGCGPVDSEASGGLAFGNALPHRLDYLLPEVYRICSHVSTVPGAASLQPAVRE
jgi:hypothetical protein